MHKGRRQVLSRRRRMTQVLLVLNGSGLMNSNVESSLQSGRRCTMQATFNSVDLTNIDQRSTRLGEDRHGSYATLLLLGCKGLSVRSLTKWEACWKWSRVRNQYCFFFFFFLHPTSHFHTGTRRQRPVGSCGILMNSLSNANAGEDSIFLKWLRSVVDQSTEIRPKLCRIISKPNWHSMKHIQTANMPGFQYQLKQIQYRYIWFLSLFG